MHTPTMSRSARIILLLVIDVLFFFVEIIVGYAVGSLALVADSFHMLNDVLSLVVALYAIKFSAKDRTAQYSYGWHRAEILAALVNGVFLLALCFSIFLEAIQRFFSAPEITNARLVVIVGSFGLASNIVGLFLFHEHGHSHEHGHGSASGTPSETPTASNSREQSPNAVAKRRQRKLTAEEHERRERSASFDNMVHPAAIRASISNLARSPSPPPRRGRRSSRSGSRSTRPHPIEEGDETVRESIDIDENTPLISSMSNKANVEPSESGQLTPTQGPSGHGHSHAGSMNMRALVLHVLGDALGNVGVIATGLIIWLTSWSFKYYFDPIISLVITVIIFHSAMPLVLSTSSILLQGVPPTVSLDNVHDAILAVPGVLAVHELHVWQLSESRVVGSVHVVADRDEDFMEVAANIHEVLHRHGIHSATIQPEYRKNPDDLRKPCLIPCPPGQACSTEENACCPPPPAEV
ncbi:cation efflux protein [Gloeophyllum trabeum ATCC 11539]|uniref:Cation efflux protein n=1 Tax=Gloeophyllum trabeum (strain ATCC 11539 / FP-39264 / Madison 617) TaxID=670483 RepID=S7QMW2_GLOTA|nr:cation efflux protein [Gloeophyllum trabeum ATCC 11539]EPQ60747.1 cation efflux protein [Gloeophyllum trabeum ATCC 11539]